MELPLGAERFTFPNANPSSPPVTPGSSRSRNASAASYTAGHDKKRHGFIFFGLSPPEHLEPRGFSHQFSYTPPHREDASSAPSVSDDLKSLENEDGIQDEDEGEGLRPEIESDGDVSERRPAIVRPLDKETDFTVEELSENDIAYGSGTEVVRPDQTEDVESDRGVSELGKDVLDALKNLHCDPEAQEKAQEFEAAQLKKYRRRKNRWSSGGLKKRSHAESLGSSSSDNADIELIEDFYQLGSSARRLRRRTKGPVDGDRPSRASLMFDDPPAEIEELGFVSGADVPPLIPDNDDDTLPPSWIMDVDSNGNRRSTAT